MSDYQMGQRKSRIAATAVSFVFINIFSVGDMLQADDYSNSDSGETSLMLIHEDKLGWSFDNGQEFKGATGSLVIDPTLTHEDHPSFRLTGDFTKGGAYVQAACPVPDLEIDKLSFWVVSPDLASIGLRVIDSKNQCHQMKVDIPNGITFHHVVVPLGRFMEDLNRNLASNGAISNHSSWEGGKNNNNNALDPNAGIVVAPVSVSVSTPPPSNSNSAPTTEGIDGKWHGPAKAIIFFISSTSARKIVSINISDVSVTVKPQAAASSDPMGK